MKTAKKTTFRAKMRKTMLVMGIVLFLVMVMTNIFNYFTKISYNQVLDGYDTLHAYYDHVETSSDYIKSYLSANNEAMLAQYDEQMSAAYRDVSSLRNNIGLSESWRYDLLENNCEHFALWCKTGISESRQVDGLMDCISTVKLVVKLLD